MVTNELINPRSIVVVGGSNDITKPGGKILKNLIDGKFKGDLYVTNPKESLVQGIKSFRNPAGLPYVDMAIIAIAAQYVPAIVLMLAYEKKTRAFIILSAGFSEESEEGKILESEIVETVNEVGGSLIGPNCIGVMTPNYNGVFTLPTPKLDPKGIDFISGSGATAVFIMESAIPKGLTFNSVFSVGNSAQMGVEEILEYMDESFEPEKSPKVKLLYIETINKPQKLLKHAASLIRKGCRIAAIKAGSSEAGSRAASSHTGALASSDVAVDAQFQKAGIVRCYGREDLIAVASVFMHKPLDGPNMAIITHAGGPAVMLTDALANGGLKVPHISNPASKMLLENLFPGSSVANPIDFLATGTAEQLGIIIDYVDQQFDEIDGMVVIFGTPGLIKVYDAYTVLDEKMKTCQKPIYPVLPSILTAKEEVAAFLSKGRINFPDEVMLGGALCRVFYSALPVPENIVQAPVDHSTIRKIIDKCNNGYIEPMHVQALLDAAAIPRAGEAVVKTKEDAIAKAQKLGYPLVMKVVGPVHKSDVGGVVLNVKTEEQVLNQFERMMKIPETTAVLLQPMLKGTELFVGAKYEPKFGHLILCGMGGIFIEVLKDVSAGLSPVSEEESLRMIRTLKSYKIIQGIRGQSGIDESRFAGIIQSVSALVMAAPEIAELDLNPLLGTATEVVAVDARIRIEKNYKSL
jgi:acetate---CoA ligase (ADP-forming)